MYGRCSICGIYWYQVWYSVDILFFIMKAKLIISPSKLTHPLQVSQSDKWYQCFPSLPQILGIIFNPSTGTRHCAKAFYSVLPFWFCNLSQVYHLFNTYSCTPVLDCSQLCITSYSTAFVTYYFKTNKNFS